MLVVKIEEYKKNRKLVYLSEDTPAFCLYTKEIAGFDIEEGKELSGETFEKIMELLSKRARERSLYLLADMARTEYQLRKKLKDGMYPEEAIDSAIEYCKGKHYIDDEDYARRFISSKADRLSRRMIEKKLYEKGIDRDTITLAFEDAGISETDTVRSIISKKYPGMSEWTFEDKQKVIRKLLNAGFSYDAIKDALQ